jgi:hypothetical protein
MVLSNSIQIIAEPPLDLVTGLPCDCFDRYSNKCLGTPSDQNIGIYQKRRLCQLNRAVKLLGCSG